MRFSSFSYLVRQGIKNAFANRQMSAASIGVLMACFLLIGSAILFSQNINAVIGYVEQQNEVVVFIKDDITEEQAEEMEKTLAAMANILSYDYISKEQALEEQRKEFGERSWLLDGFEEDNPFPASYNIKVEDLSLFRQTLLEIKILPGISSVLAPEDVAATVVGIKNVSSVSQYGIVGILIVVSMIIIANTIKITVFNRRREVNIMKLVGATDFFIKFPFVVEGLVIGLLSALLAYIMLWFGYDYLYNYVVETESVMMNLIKDNLIPFSKVAGSLGAIYGGAGGFIGMFGSLFFVQKYLKV